MMDKKGEEEIAPVRGHNSDYCWTCGLVLASAIERLIGVHVRCVHRENQRALSAPDLKVPSYSGPRTIKR